MLEEIGGSMYQQPGAGPNMGGGAGNAGNAESGNQGSSSGYEHVKKGKKKGKDDNVVEGDYEKVDE